MAFMEIVWNVFLFFFLLLTDSVSSQSLALSRPWYEISLVFVFQVHLV